MENLMLNDSWWAGVEALQMRVPDNHSKRLQQILDEEEYKTMEREDRRDEG